MNVLSARGRRTQNLAAFTLLELSIALVIIGLLVGGVLGGRHLIESAKISNLMSDTKKYETAIHNFREKYNALPGDMSNASDYWSDCLDITASLDCNGNGNLQIGEYAGLDEVQRAWQHLALAGLIEGSYDPTGMDVNAYYSNEGVGYRGINPDSMAQAAYPDEAIYTFGVGSNVSTGTEGFLYGRRYFVIAKVDASLSNQLNEAFSTEALQLIDQKFDDGGARSGKIYTVATWSRYNTPSTYTAVTCSTTSNTYQLSSTIAACPMFYDLDY